MRAETLPPQNVADRKWSAVWVVDGVWWKPGGSRATAANGNSDQCKGDAATCCGNCHTHEYTRTNCDANSDPYRESDAYDSAIANAA
jgi:cytochrome c553